jgi:hypothetical protein
LGQEAERLTAMSMLATSGTAFVILLVVAAGYLVATRPCESGHHRRHLRRRRYEPW